MVSLDHDCLLPIHAVEIAPFIDVMATVDGAAGVMQAHVLHAGHVQAGAVEKAVIQIGVVQERIIQSSAAQIRAAQIGAAQIRPLASGLFVQPGFMGFQNGPYVGFVDHFGPFGMGIQRVGSSPHSP